MVKLIELVEVGIFTTLYKGFFNLILFLHPKQSEVRFRTAALTVILSK